MLVLNQNVVFYYLSEDEKMKVKIYHQAGKKVITILILSILLLTVAACGADSADQPYHVVYNGNGNTAGTPPIDDKAYDGGETATVLGNTGGLEKTGYVFDGWNTQADGNGTDYAVGSDFAIIANKILYAKWIPNTLNGQYKLSAVTEEHEAPCDFFADQNSSVPLLFVYNSYKNLTFTFSHDGTYTVENIPPSDQAFSTESGTYQKNGELLTLTDGINSEKQLILTYVDESTLRLLLSSFVIDDETDIHNGCTVMQSFVFTKIEE